MTCLTRVYDACYAFEDHPLAPILGGCLLWATLWGGLMLTGVW